MTEHVMVDLETMGTSNFAVICSIGAVKFDPFGDGVSDKFYCAVDMESCAQLGMRFEGKTIAWWLAQKEKAREAILQKPQDITSALFGFSHWFGRESLPVWGNGATFDNVILRNAFTLIKSSCPWSYKHDMCYRTERRLDPDGVLFSPVGTAHNALDDAEAQALHLQKIVRHFNLHPQHGLVTGK